VTGWVLRLATDAALAGRPGWPAKSLKFLLDDDLKSSIEWQASLIESQLEIAARQRSEFRSMNTVGETK
jgi:hypothetical protein